MLRLASNLFAKVGKGSTGGRLDTSRLTAAQLKDIRDTVQKKSTASAGDAGTAGDSKITWRKHRPEMRNVGSIGYLKSTGAVWHKRPNKNLPWIHLRDGQPAIQKVKSSNIDFDGQGYPNYPGDPLPSTMPRWRLEFQKPKMQRNFYKKEVAIQFAPFRRTLINVAYNSQGILPKQLIESAKSEFVSVTKGQAVARGEPKMINRFSTFRYANPRKTKKERCVIGGAPLGVVARYRMRRNMYREFADHGKIAGTGRALWGPVPPRGITTHTGKPRKWHNTVYDDLPVYD